MKLVYFLVVLLLVEVALAGKSKKKSGSSEEKKHKKGKGKVIVQQPVVVTTAPTCPTCPPQITNFLRTTVVCEDEGRKLRCPAGTTIMVTEAFYGRRSRSLCPRGANTDNTKCTAPNPVASVKARCDNRNECDISAINTWFSDPCPDTFKYLDLDYFCERSAARRG